jgi:hypothetical protein
LERKKKGAADAVKVGSGRPVVVFDIAGNKFRLLTAIHYNLKKVFVLRFLTHAQYSKGKWTRRAMRTKHTSRLPREASKTYEELVRLYIPRKIHDEVGRQNATELVDWLAVRAITPDQVEFQRFC